MKTRYILYPLLALMAILLPTSCSTEEDFMDSSITSNGDKVTFTLGVSVPGATNVASRAFINGDSEATGFDSDYYNFDNLFVAVFEQASDGNYYYQGASPVELSGTATHDGKTCSTYKVTLTATNNPCRLHIIANYEDLSMGLNDEGEAIGRLKTKADNQDVYWNFVGLDEGIQNTDESKTAIQAALQHVPLVRNYAKVQLNLGNDLPNGFFKGYKLYNMPEVGTVAAYNPNATGNKFVNFVGKDYPTLATTAKYLGNESYNVTLFNDADFKTEVQEVTVEGTTEKEKISAPTYMYERKNTDSNNQLLANAAFIIVKGELNGTTYYYKLDFVDSENKPYNLLRNFVYTVTVTGVNGPGYATEAEAVAQPAGNNLNASAAIKDFTNISNGTQQLFVSTTSLMITQDKEYYLYYKYISNLSQGTIANSSVVITGGGIGNVLETAAVNTPNGGTGDYAGWGMIKLDPKTPGAYTTQVLTFTADNLQRTVTLTAQQPSSEMSVSLNPASVAMQSEQDVAVNISLPAALGDSPSLFPLRMFIYSEDNTIYATSLPVEIRNGKYGFIREITLEEFGSSTTTTTDDGKKVFSSAFKTNCDNSETTVWVEHDYFKSASAKLGNEKLTSIEIAEGLKVDIQQDGQYQQNFYPSNIYNTGNNDGTESVTTIKLNNTTLTGSITINKDNVTEGTTIESDSGFNSDDVLTFTFSDKYCTGVSYRNNRWTPNYSTNNSTYTATCTVEELLSGKTLHFTHP